MKKRYIYLLLFAIPGFILSGVISFVVGGTAAGILWIFVFGDNPWPPYAEQIVAILFVLVFLILSMAFIAAGFMIGKREEGNPVFNKKHVLLSAGITLAAVLFIIFQQWNVGNIGP